MIGELSRQMGLLSLKMDSHKNTMDAIVNRLASSNEPSLNDDGSVAVKAFLPLKSKEEFNELNDKIKAHSNTKQFLVSQNQVKPTKQSNQRSDQSDQELDQFDQVLNLLLKKHFVSPLRLLT